MPQWINEKFKVSEKGLGGGSKNRGVKEMTWKGKGGGLSK